MYTALRSGRFYTKTFTTGLIVLCSAVVITPLVITMKFTFEDADRICEERTRRLWKDWESPDGIDWDLEDWENQYQLLPVHVFNCISLAVSLVCFLVWLFFSPHNTELGKELDRKCANSSPPYLLLPLFLNVLLFATRYVTRIKQNQCSPSLLSNCCPTSSSPCRA